MTLKTLARLTLVLLIALPAAASAEVADLPPVPQRNPFRAPVKPKPVLPKDQPTLPWTEAEIDAATAKCKTLLTGDPLDYEMLPPIKEGLCGTPAPVLLRAVGHDPKVTLDPPATLSCPMADTLGEWLRNTVQPEAKKLFGSHVVKIQNSSSYVCRNRYNGTNTLLSEHALANAFDVSQFVLANGTRISVLDHPFVRPKIGAPGSDIVTPQVATEEDYGSGHPSNPFIEPKAGDRGEDAVTPAKVESTPPPPPSVTTEPVSPDAKSQFVTFLFEDACRHFGTVLGPNANEAHKDHFHLDMKARRKSNFCE
jgi:hypothetical protein